MLCGWIVPLKQKLTVPSKDARRVLTLHGFDCNEEGTLVWVLSNNDLLNPLTRTQFLKLCDATGGGMSVYTSLARPFALYNNDDILRLHMMTAEDFRRQTKVEKVALVDLYSCLKDLGCINENADGVFPRKVAVSNKKPKELTKKEIRKQARIKERKARKAEERKAKKLARKLDAPSVKPRADRTD